MTAVAVRQSGGANIISIPKAIVKSLGLEVGSKLDLSIIDDRIVLTPIRDELTLNQVLEASPKEYLAVRDEDKEWLDSPSQGREL